MTHSMHLKANLQCLNQYCTL